MWKTVDSAGGVFAKTASDDEKRLLFTTKTCPQCPRAKEELEGMNVTMIDAENQIDLSRRYGVRSVPTLVVERNGKIENFNGINGIMKFKKGF